MIKEYFKIAIQSLTRRKLRSWLTLIGIFIGIAAVVALISLGQGMEKAIIGEFQKIGGDVLFIQMGAELGSMGEGATNNPLTINDAKFLEGLSGIHSMTYYIFGSVKTEYQGITHYHYALGIPTEQSRLELFNTFYSSYGFEEGRSLEAGDKNSLVMGWYHISKGLWDEKNVKVGDKIIINDNNFHIVGIIGPTGSPPDDKQLLMTDRAFREYVQDTERVDAIVVKVIDEKNVQATAEEIKRQLAKYRGVKIEDIDFTVQTPEDLLESFEKILNIVQAVLIGIALISLFVGGIGIMNTMYTSVIERNKDIGIMKAIGAKNEDIFALFFIESGLLGLAGGILGIAIGSGLAWMVEFISTQALGKSFLQAYFSWELFVGAILFSFIVGAIAGTLPAIQAAKQKPADTLRDE
jgi:putative ABC transport system permease protein